MNTINFQLNTIHSRPQHIWFMIIIYDYIYILQIGDIKITLFISILKYWCYVSDRLLNKFFINYDDVNEITYLYKYNSEYKYVN